MTSAVKTQRGFDGCVCFIGESSPQTASIKPRTVQSRAECENGALTKIVIFVTGRKGVITLTI